MTKSKKFDFRIIQVDTTWKAEITRRMTARKTIVSKRKKGFATEADATAWAEKELAGYIEKLAAKNKRHSEERAKAEADQVAKDQAEAERIAKFEAENAQDQRGESDDE